MEVVENKYGPEYPKTILCSYCKSILKYFKEDEFIEVNKEYDHINREHYKTSVKMLKCPCCKCNFKV